MKNSYNLIDELWIPVADYGLVSLRQIFTHSKYRSLGGNPVQKIALMKLLLAISQAANTPNDDEEWKTLGSHELAVRCLKYLEKWHDSFYLYGDHPFLQMPEIATAKIQAYGAVSPQISTGNTTVLSQIQIQRMPDDADKALLIVSLMGFALGGKKTDNSIVLSPGYQGKCNEKGKPSTSKPGPAVAHMGLLHSFLYGNTILETLWLNLLTQELVAHTNMFEKGVGIAPWEQMPAGEDCSVALNLKQSLMGRLIPLCRFCLLSPNGLHYSEGLAHQGYKEGVTDPSIAVNYSGKEPKALWTNPEKRPWRQLTALLGFFGQSDSNGFQSWQIKNGLDRARDVVESFGVWSGGLGVSSNAGEQYVKGSDDFVESLVFLQCDMLGEIWFIQLKSEMDELEVLSKSLYGRVIAYYKTQNVDANMLAGRASHQFWQLSERNFQQLVDSCNQDDQSRQRRQHLRRNFAGYVQQAYNQFCPNDSARQLDAWAKCQPNNSKYLNQEI